MKFHASSAFLVISSKGIEVRVLQNPSLSLVSRRNFVTGVIEFRGLSGKRAHDIAYRLPEVEEVRLVPWNLTCLIANCGGLAG